MAHIVQAFSQLQAGAATEDDTSHGIYYVFGYYYKNHAQIENKPIQLEELLQQQPNPEKPATAFTTLLIDPDPTKTCKTGKNKHMKCKDFCLHYCISWC